MIKSFITPLKELSKGLLIVLKNGFKKRVTLKYPEQKKQLNNNFRGKINYEKEKCIKCGICKKVCPLKDCIIINESFSINLSQCIFCGNCVENCPQKALSFSGNYELSTTNKEELIIREVLN